MPALTIGWEYLTGYAVATDPSSRDRAEWPPHPGRLFMALAAAWFETGEDPAECAALRWLETQGDPELHLPPIEPAFERSIVTVYVPINDKAGPSTATLQSAPAITRSKQPRTFPRIWIGDAPCFIRWANAVGGDGHRAALDVLCGKVTRIGHSSSLVRLWVADDVPQSSPLLQKWITDDLLADRQTRQVSPGTLDMLIERYGELSRRQRGSLTDQIDAIQTQRKGVKGKGADDRKATYDQDIARLTKERDAINDRPPLRPTLGLWSGYRVGDYVTATDQPAHSHFDTDMLVLTHVEGPALPLASSLAVTGAMRDAVMKNSGVQPAPAWVNGHHPEGGPLRDDDGHMGVIPLPFVGSQYADGHLLGVGLVLPRAVDRRERGRVLGKLLLDETGKPKCVRLTLGRLGVWSLMKRDWTETRAALRPETWTAQSDGAAIWASVTPVVLDRFPKTDRTKDRGAWTEEVAAIVANSCKRIGLPLPVGIDIDTTAWHQGSPRAVAKRRPLRDQAGASSGADAVLGDGFPSFPPKGTNSPRPQVHVWLRFSEPVIGPVLLGAGRYLGYGLCKPLREGGQ